MTGLFFFLTGKEKGVSMTRNCEMPLIQKAGIFGFCDWERNRPSCAIAAVPCNSKGMKNKGLELGS